MNDLEAAVLSALAELPACSAPVFAREEVPLPVIAVQEDSSSVSAQADGLPYLTEHILSLHVYAAQRETARSLARQADEAMTGLGLRLTGSQEEYDETAWAWRKTLRYRALLHQDTIYQ